MEFTYSDYLVRITFNPSDIIVLFEHSKTFRSYSQTFFERDFPQASLLGGMKFLEKVLTTVFSEPKSGELSIDKFNPSNSLLSFDIVFTNPLFATPVTLHFELPANRKESANIDLSQLNRKVKEIHDDFEPRMKKLTEAVGLLDKLFERLEELEERCGNTIALPGCIYAIPINTQSLILVRNQTFLPDGRGFSYTFPQASITGSSNCGGINWHNPYAQVNNGWSAISPCSDAFIYDKLTSIANIKYLKECKSLVLSGCHELRDFEPLGKMTSLTHLSIINTRGWNQNAPHQAIGNNPTLTDIKWIKHLKNLQSVSFLGCTQLSDITPLRELPNLRELDIRETAVRNTDFLLNPNLKITK